MDFVARAQWGAKPPRDDWTWIDRTSGVKVHYEGTAVPADLVGADQHGRCAGRVRDIQASHMANTAEKWIDIAYNAMVCPHGTVFEGRGAHHRTGANGNGTLNDAHYAVCAMVGSSGLVSPTTAQLGGILDAVAWLRSAGGAGPEIACHQDGYPTDCPGGPLTAWVRAGAPRPKTTTSQENDMQANEIATAPIPYRGADGKQAPVTSNVGDILNLLVQEFAKLARAQADLAASVAALPDAIAQSVINVHVDVTAPKSS